MTHNLIKVKNKPQQFITSSYKVHYYKVSNIIVASVGFDIQ